MKHIVSLALAFACAFPGALLAQSQRKLPDSASLSSGKLAGVKVVSARAQSAFTLVEGNNKIEVKVNDQIENLQISSADLTGGTATGGTFDLPAKLELDAERGTVTPDALKGTVLRGASLKSVTIAGAQALRHNGKDLKGTFTVNGSIELVQANLADKVDVTKPTVLAAALQPKPAKPARTETADVNLLGDFFVIKARVEHFGISDSDAPGALVAPKGACFRVSKEFEKVDPADQSKSVKFVSGTFSTGWFPRFLLPPYTCPSEEEMAGIDTDLQYDVERRYLIEDRDRSRFGWTYGVMVAPFKYYVDSQNFNAGATVGPYLGYRFHDRPGSSSIIGLAVGAANATVKTNNPDGTSSSQEKTGVSIAAAWLLEIKKDFNMGAMLGADYFSKIENIPNSGKAWVGISFGRKID